MSRQPVGRRRRAPREYRSPQTVAGIPLLHLATGGWDAHGRYRPGRARGLIAIGDIAVGLVAMGGVAIGLLALGGVAIGLIALAGLAVGVVAAGGVAIGLTAWGAVALGVKAYGAVTSGAIAAHCRRAHHADAMAAQARNRPHRVARACPPDVEADRAG